MDAQVEYIEKALEQVSPKSDPVKVIYVDWASEEQHEGNGTPLRDIVSDPVLQSPWHDEEDSFQAQWCDGKLEGCDFAMFALDKAGCVVGRFSWLPDATKDPLSLEQKSNFEKFRRVVRLAIAGSLDAQKYENEKNSQEH